MPESGRKNAWKGEQWVELRELTEAVNADIHEAGRRAVVKLASHRQPHPMTW